MDASQDACTFESDLPFPRKFSFSTVWRAPIVTESFYTGFRVEYGSRGVGMVSRQLFSALTNLQMGLSEDKMNWTMELAQVFARSFITQMHELSEAEVSYLSLPYLFVSSSQKCVPMQLSNPMCLTTCFPSSDQLSIAAAQSSNILACSAEWPAWYAC